MLLLSLYMAITGACKLIEFWEKYSYDFSAMVCGLLLLSDGYWLRSYVSWCIRSGIYSIWKFSPFVKIRKTPNLTSEKQNSNAPLFSKVDSLVEMFNPDVLKIPGGINYRTIP